MHWPALPGTADARLGAEALSAKPLQRLHCCAAGNRAGADGGAVSASHLNDATTTMATQLSVRCIHLINEMQGSCHLIQVTQHPRPWQWTIWQAADAACDRRAPLLNAHTLYHLHAFFLAVSYNPAPLYVGGAQQRSLHWQQCIRGQRWWHQPGGHDTGQYVVLLGSAMSLARR